MKFLNKIFAAPKSREQLNAEYLAKSVSLADLERRQRDLDHRNYNQRPFGY